MRRAAARHSPLTAGEGVGRDEREQAGKTGLEVLPPQGRAAAVAPVDLADQARLAQHAEVMGQGRLADRQIERHAGPLAAVRGADEVGHHAPPQRIGQSRQNGAEFHLLAAGWPSASGIATPRPLAASRRHHRCIGRALPSDKPRTCAFHVERHRRPAARSRVHRRYRWHS